MERAIAILREELGWHLQAVAFDMIAAVLERHAEVPTKVVERLEPPARQLLDFGMVAYASTQFAMLAQAQYELGDRDAALASATRCEELTASDDIINFAIVNGVRARIAADGGDGEQARTLAERASGRSSRTGRSTAEMPTATSHTCVGRRATSTAPAPRSAPRSPSIGRRRMPRWSIRPRLFSRSFERCRLGEPLANHLGLIVRCRASTRRPSPV